MHSTIELYLPGKHKYKITEQLAKQDLGLAYCPQEKETIYLLPNFRKKILNQEEIVRFLFLRIRSTFFQSTFQTSSTMQTH